MIIMIQFEKSIIHDLDAISTWIKENITPLRTIPQPIKSIKLLDVYEDHVEIVSIDYDELEVRHVRGIEYHCELCGSHDWMENYVDIVEHLKREHADAWESFKIS